MLSMNVMSSGQENYYIDLAAEDYYLNGGEPDGIWYGEGAKDLGLSGVVRAADLRALFRGYSPQGVPLVQNPVKAAEASSAKAAKGGARRKIPAENGKKKKKRRRDPGWDLTFSVPKSVSVLWSQADDDLRQRIQAIIERGFRKTIAFLEAEAAYCRVGRGGKRKVKAKLVVSGFVHGTSRTLDPHYHIHGLLLNAGLCPDGKYRALSSIDLFRHKMVAGVFFRADVAHGLQDELGVKLIRPLDKKGKKKKSWFEIDGVMASLMKAFSKRRDEIEEALGRMKLESAAAAAVAAKATRKKKGVIPPREVLLAKWQAEGRRHGFTQATIKRILGRVGKTSAAKQERRYKKALHEAVAEMTAAESHFTGMELLRKTLEGAQSWGLEPNFVKESVERDLRNPRMFVELGQKGGRVRYSTPEVLAVEKLLVESIDKLHESAFTPLDAKVVENIIRHPHHAGTKTVWDKLQAQVGLRGEGNLLSAEQADALRYLTQGKGRIKILNGLAGSGKTTLLSAMDEAFQRAGYRVIGGSVAGVAAQGLQSGAGIESDTVKMRLKQMSPDPAWMVKQHARQLCRAACGKRTYRPKRLKIGRRDVLVVDEAGMLETNEFAQLAKAVVDGGGIMVCVGDHRQLPSIGAGGGFEFIGNRVGKVDLQDIGRQTDHLQRELVKALVRGEAELVMKVFAESGRLHVAKNQDHTAEKLIRDWKEQGGIEQPKDHVIVVATNREVARYNDLAQRERAQAGKLDLRQSVLVGEEKLYPGDRVIFTRKSRKLGVENGDRGILVSVKPWSIGTTVAVQLDRNKKTVVIPVRQVFGESYQGLERGYAFTTHKLQGATVENSYIHLGGKMTTKEMAYVQCSRQRESIRLYTEELEAGRKLTRLVREHEKREAKQEAEQVRKEEPERTLGGVTRVGWRPPLDLAQAEMPRMTRESHTESARVGIEETIARREHQDGRDLKHGVGRSSGQLQRSETDHDLEEGRRGERREERKPLQESRLPAEKGWQADVVPIAKAEEQVAREEVREREEKSAQGATSELKEGLKQERRDERPAQRSTIEQKPGAKLSPGVGEGRDGVEESSWERLRRVGQEYPPARGETVRHESREARQPGRRQESQLAREAEQETERKPGATVKKQVQEKLQSADQESRPEQEHSLLPEKIRQRKEVPTAMPNADQDQAQQAAREANRERKEERAREKEESLLIKQMEKSAAKTLALQIVEEQQKQQQQGRGLG